MRLEFRKNLGDTDRVIRAVIGVFLLGWVLTGVATGWWAVVAGVLAVSQFIEAALAY